MRNLKRALSLGLTAAMISGLMVMGSSAASYADVTSENNVEAIEVLEAVGIMIGDENGNFNPDQNVTRNEMAVIMANLMEYNVATYKDTSPFTDVPSWAEPYVAACYTNGITSGYSDTIYGLSLIHISRTWPRGRRPPAPTPWGSWPGSPGSRPGTAPGPG